MNDLLAVLEANVWAQNVVMTLGLLVALLGLQWLLVRALRGSKIKSLDLKRRWLVQIRNLCFALFVVGALIIWAAELRTLALSLVAVLVALVLATKELILCFSGSLVKAASGTFTVGDRIEVGGVRGEVVDQTLMVTTVMEIGPGSLTHQFTGRSVTLPNSLFLSVPVFNENLLDDFIFHVMVFPLKASEDCVALSGRLGAIADEVGRDWLETAKRRMARLVERQGLDTPSIEPRVSLEFPDPDRVNLLLRMTMPSDRKGVTEREIRTRFLEARRALLLKEGGLVDGGVGGEVGGGDGGDAVA
ncbi:Mechanosensitive ion channel [Mucisphaera calidilacus]|uniref:Mechanosensitive ion channel n=2 Tax=Mucisphaera calidilacus TaxID=2527982 RepID=A0A518BYT1_9BACT|nr:Mechanosensitive ion channel [Mucisphaera calidilacus]